MPDRSTDHVGSPVPETEWSETDGESHSPTQSTLSTSSVSRLWRSLCGFAVSLWATLDPTSIRVTESAASASAEAVDAQASRRASSLFRDAESLAHDGKSTDTAGYSDHPLLGVDSELLNPERRILQLLLVEGGVLAQAEIVERSRWSDSTISRTLCRMEAQERIVRRQDGGGKLVILPQTNT